jgi:hypothetical protein
VSDIDTVPEDSLKAFDFDRPIREATKHSRRSETSLRAICRHMQCSKKSVAIRPRSSSQLCLSLCSCIMRKTKAWFKNIALAHKFKQVKQKPQPPYQHEDCS